MQITTVFLLHSYDVVNMLVHRLVVLLEILRSAKNKLKLKGKEEE